MDPSDLVASWDVPLAGCVHLVEFEHGTTTGKRIIRVDGKEIVKKDWQFKLVGKEPFSIKDAKCVISIKALGSFAYEYSLDVNGRPFKKFTENQSKLLSTWCINLEGEPTRICLEKDTLNVYVNGRKMDTAGEFVDNGTETHFEIGEHICYIKAASSGKRKQGVLHQLFVDDREIPQDT